MYYKTFYEYGTCIIIKMYFKHRLQIQDLHSVLTARTWRAHYALKKTPQRCHSVATASSQRPHSTLSRALCKRQDAALTVHV